MIVALRRICAPRHKGGSLLSWSCADKTQIAEWSSTLSSSPAPILSEVAGEVSPPLLNDTLSANLRRIVDHVPTNHAIISVEEGNRLSYEQFLAEVEAVASSLLAFGIQHGERVAIWAPNCTSWTVLQHATAMVGAIQVSLNPALREHELEHALQRSGTSLIVLAPEFKGASQISVLERIHQRLPLLKHPPVVLGRDAPPGWLRWDDFRSAGQGRAAEEAVLEREQCLQPTDAINIQFTSGTTGLPKAATLTHRNIVNNGFMIGHLLGYSPADRVCIPVPLFHCFGQVLGNIACTTHGATMVYPGAAFDPEATLRAVQSERCTSLYGVPSQFITELEYPSFASFNLSSLRTGIMAGAPCPVEIMRRVRNLMHMKGVSVCFGMTETSPVSFQTRLDDSEERRVCTVGRVHPHVEARVVDPTTKETLERGVAGELLVRGYSVMQGYWSDPEATAGMIDADGWCHTGDLAVLDSEGYCKIVGRIKDVVIRGGENLFPKEIEDFLHTHPAIANVQVFGVPDERMGEQLCVWVKLRDAHASVSTQALKEWCVDKISRHKIPKYWKVVTEFPHTQSGKPQKFIMRRMAMEELGLGEQKTPAVEGVCT